jgi:hypothetical protein
LTVLIRVRLQVTPAAAAALSTTTDGPGLVSVTAGEQTTFAVFARDRFNNPVAATVTVTSAPTLAFAIATGTDNKTGIPLPAAFVTYTPETIRVPNQMYVVTVLVNGVVAKTANVLVAPAPAPKLLSATLSPSLASVDLAFDRQTNRANLPAGYPVPCSAVVTSASLSSLGSGPACVFDPSGTVFRMVFGPGATAMPTGAVSAPTVFTLRENVVAAAGDISYNASGAARLRLDAFTVDPTLVTPVVALSAPSVVGTCDEVMLDAGGVSKAGGRAVNYAFTLAKYVPPGDGETIADQQKVCSCFQRNPLYA